MWRPHQKLLAEAGYPNGEGFPKVELLYYTSESDKKICEAIQQMWKDNLNITVDLRNEDKSVCIQTKRDGKFDISLSGWSAGYYEAGNMIKRSSWALPAWLSGVMLRMPVHRTIRR